MLRGAIMTRAFAPLGFPSFRKFALVYNRLPLALVA